jgi:hypothetical protein
MSKKAAWIVPVMLEGHFVRLEPIKPKHARQLAKVVDPEFFRYFLGG